METNFEKEKQDRNMDNQTGQGNKEDFDLDSADITGDIPDTTKSDITAGMDRTRAELENPFRRKPMLVRTPPARRALSAPNEKELITKAISSWTLPLDDQSTRRERENRKRKSDGDSPTEDSNKEIQHKKQREEIKNMRTEDMATENTRKVEESIKKSKNIGTGTPERSRGPDKNNESLIIKLMENIVKEIKVLRSIVHEHKNTKVKIKDSSSRLEKMVLILERLRYTKNLWETGSGTHTTN